MTINRRIFRAYDIRGIYPSEINDEVALKIGRAFGKTRKGTVVVGRDGRIGSLKLYRAVIKGLKNGNSKLKIAAVGLATTPMFYVLVQKLGAAGGIMVTASHNPKEYNGFKVVGRNARMISGKEVLKIISKF